MRSSDMRLLSEKAENSAKDTSGLRFTNQATAALRTSMTRVSVNASANFSYEPVSTRASAPKTPHPSTGWWSPA